MSLTVIHRCQTSSHTNDDEESILWECAICGERNASPGCTEEIPHQEETDYVLGRADDGDRAVTGDRSIVVFCIDTSGSMGVSQALKSTPELLAMKKEREKLLSGADSVHAVHSPAVVHVSRLEASIFALSNQISLLCKHHPKRRVGLVSFASEVTLHGDCTSAVPVTLAGDQLDSADLLQQKLKSVFFENGDDVMSLQPISKSYKGIQTRLLSLKENGQTALGPALVSAVGIASQCDGSSVVMCTDGVSNVGCGAFDNGSSEESTKEFLRRVGDTALASNVTVNMMTFTENFSKIEYLGIVSDITNGSVSQMQQKDIEKTIGSVYKVDGIGT